MGDPSTPPPTGVPADRLRACNRRPWHPQGAYVLYWMIANRRRHYNFALEHAVGLARALARPLVILEALRCDYPWASDRLHTFILQGMADNAASFAGTGVLYYPWVERVRGEGKGLLEALAAHATVVVTDDTPAFFLPRMVASAAARLPVALVAVDSVGLLPLAASSSPFSTAFAFRRHLQRRLPAHLTQLPKPDPLADVALPPPAPLPPGLLARWPPASAELLGATPQALASLPIDHSVPPVPTRGGERAAEATLGAFIAKKLAGYHEARNDVEVDGTSGLSPYLHFGHISPHRVFAAVAEGEGWGAEAFEPPPSRGERSGWWGMSPGAEAFLDQLITWRELGHVLVHHRPDADHWDSLPPWARATLTAHAADPREYLYTLEEFAAGTTHDPLWNAAQGQLRRAGTIHNYLRMLWGKKILEWSASPAGALAFMLELNNRFALDGRDPNSVSGITWCLGRFDRPWGPERPIFGTVRFMSSRQTARKMNVANYIQTWSR